MRNLTISAIIVVAVTAAVFSQARAYNFVNYKDPQFVTENEFIQQGLNAEGIRWAFTTFETGSWIPLTWMSYMTDAELFGSNPAGYHLINLLIHMANALLLLFLLNEFFKNAWVACLAALIFAVHPLNVEPVMWIAARQDLLALFFALTAMLAYLTYAQKPSIPRYALVTILFLLALMSKPIIVTLPFILLMLDAWPLSRWQSGEPAQKSKLLLEKLPWFGLSVMFVFIHYAVQGNPPTIVEPLSAGYSVDHAFLNLGRYVFLFLPDHDMIPYRSPYDFEVPIVNLVFFFVFIIGFSLGPWRARKEVPASPLGWFWYLLAIVPVVGFFQLGQQTLADRFMYLPQIGLIIAVAGVLYAGAREKRILSIIFPIAAILLIGYFSSISWRQAAVWRNSNTLFEHTLAVDPDNIIGHTYLGLSQIENPKTFQNGINHLETATKKLDEISDPRPGASPIYDSLGAAYLRQLKFTQATPILEKAVHHDPMNGDAHRNLAFAYWQLQKLFPAREHCLRALDINPTDEEAGKLLQLLFP
jgi:tetratricopeptide (TPR) repeat protein